MTGVNANGRLSLSLACWDYDRTRALADGRVRPEGIDLTYISLPVEETFFRTITYAEFDVAELSLSSFVLSRDRGDERFVALPIFPSRSFRHSGIYVAEGGGIKKPTDLAGRRVGLAEYQLTALVWIRGILAEFHELPFDAVTYVTAGLEEAGRREKIPVEVPERVRIEAAPPGSTLSQMLQHGEIDAIYSPRTPSTLGAGVRRLYPDFETAERDYFQRSQIFPIMHTMVLKRTLYEAHPWTARSLIKAFDAALAYVESDLQETTALKYALPWAVSQAEAMHQLMGPNPWANGVEQNRSGLETFLRYAHEQGLIQELPEAAALFVPESIESFAI